MMNHDEQMGRPVQLYLLATALRAGPRPADEVRETLEPYLATNPITLWRLEYAHVLAMLGRFDEARAVAEEAGRRMEELGSVDSHGADSNAIAPAEIATLAGDHEAAARHFQAFCRSVEESGNHSALSTYLPALGHSLCMLGRYEEAEPLAQRGRELGGEGDVWTQMLWRRVLALVSSHRGEHDEAERLAREAIAISEKTDILYFQGDAFCDLADVLEHAGRRDEVLDALHQALDRYERKKNLAMVAQVKARLAEIPSTAEAR